MRYIFLTLLGILLIPALSWAQTPGAVRFQSGAETFPENGNAFSLTALNPTEVVEGRYYRFVQFYQTPTAQQRAQMEREGLQFLGYIPKSTYLVSFPASYDRVQLAAHAVYSVMPVEAHHKMADVLVNQSLPDWAVNGDQIDLTVAFAADQAYADVVAKLQAAGILILTPQRRDATIEVRLPINQMYALAAQPYIHWMEAIPGPAIPDDNRGRGLSRANVIDTDNPLGRQYDGSGIRILVRDDGPVEDHIDYKGRLKVDGATRTGGSFHGHMVAGVFTGGGNLDPRNRGTAPGAELYTLSYNASFTDGTLNLHLIDSVMITNSSYSDGCNGGYTTVAQRVDNQIHTNKSLLHVFSAGNSNNQNCGYGAGNQWGNVTGGHKQGKNAMTVANLNTNGILENSSSRGPATDGRIKPDISANGQGQVSTDYDNSLQGAGGTSAAAPTAAGSVAQLYQAYRTLNNGEYPQSALIKALILNTAEDYGRPGPDFNFGWGRVNAFHALQVMEKGQYFSDTVGQGQLDAHPIIVPGGVSELRVMVYWNDPSAAVQSSVNLVNDLDMTLRDTINNTTLLPLILDYRPSTLSLTTNAFPGRDSVNNMEQVRVVNPASGTYTLNVTGKDVPQGPQEYFVVYEFITDEITVTYPFGGEGFVPGEVENIHWDAYGTTGTFALEYSIDSGATWNSIATVPGADRLYNWTVPNVVSGEALVRITRGTQSDMSDYPFTIIGVPDELEVLTVCSNSSLIQWESVPGATGYQVYQLGDKYMEPIGTFTDTVNCVPVNTLGDPIWVAVSALIGNGPSGQRTIALEVETDSITCQGDDIQVVKVDPEAAIPTILCTDDTLDVTLTIFNPGTMLQAGYNYGVTIDQMPPITASSTDTIAPCEIAEQMLTISYDTLSAGMHTLKVWTTFPGDINPQNDTFSYTIEIIGGNFLEDFETFELCGTNSNCELGVCDLTNGWVNLVNGEDDDIDWRTNSGSTPSNNTGPGVDHNPGTVTGKYLYLEASGCFGEEAIMLSPCINLDGMFDPNFSFWYHMDGASMGELHVDLNDGTGWTLDIMPALIGNQGGSWQNANISLSSYSGNSIQLRFRGVTGPSFTSDIAIDDISLVDFAAPPLAGFESNIQAGCPAEEFYFTDQSFPAPQSWLWSFSPNQVLYLNGTDSTSQNPVVQFLQTGSYDVSLKVSNQTSSDSITRSTYIQVSQGNSLPLIQNFDQEVLCDISSNCEIGVCDLSSGAGWRNAINGERDDIDWRVNEGSTPSNNTGPSFDHTSGTPFGNYIYLEASQCFGQEAHLLSECIFIDSTDNAFLSFWYHMNGSDMGSLHVDIRTDAGWTRDIATTLSGDRGDIWLQEIVDLKDYRGQNVQLRMRAITGPDFRSDLALDDIEIINVEPPVAKIIPASDSNCVFQTVMISDSSLGNNLTYQWNFGAGASPDTANSAGPHVVSWSTPGTKVITLTIFNAFGNSTEIIPVFVTPLPSADFGVVLDSGSSYSFVNQSSANSTGYFWDFGDGTTSTATNPTHVYQTRDTFEVSLITTGACGNDTSIQEVVVTTVTSTGRAFKDLGLTIAPNPANTSFEVAVEGDRAGEVKLALLDLRGKAIEGRTFYFRGGTHREEFQVSGLAEGIYMLRIQIGEESVYRQVVIK